MELNPAILQGDIVEWHQKNFPKESLMGSAMAICEEAGEVGRAYSKQECGIRGSWDHWQAEKAKELGDVMIAVINACAREGFDWEECLLQRWETIRARDYVKYPETGGRELE